jgi:hypothetical protein
MDDNGLSNFKISTSNLLNKARPEMTAMITKKKFTPFLFSIFYDSINVKMSSKIVKNCLRRDKIEPQKSSENAKKTVHFFFW